MKSILRSIKPYWLYMILTKHKTIEVAKNFPKSEGWNGIVEMYCSKDMRSFNRIPEKDRVWMSKYVGKVACRFVCDEIKTYPADDFVGAEDLDGTIIAEPKDGVFAYWIPEEKETCLPYEEIIAYGNGKTLYGWHISDLKIYDKPKELDEFLRVCPYDVHCWRCEFYSTYNGKCNNFVTLPPQSWCFVEE